MTQFTMQLINCHLNSGLSSVLPLEWASRKHPVKSTFHLYHADNCSFIIIDSAGGPSKDNSRSGGRYTADRDQCNSHCWHIQDILQKDSRCLLLSIR